MEKFFGECCAWLDFSDLGYCTPGRIAQVPKWHTAAERYSGAGGPVLPFCHAKKFISCCLAHVTLFVHELQIKQIPYSWFQMHSQTL